MSVWATPTDVTDAWLADDPPPTTGKIQTWIDKAEREIRRQVPDIQARIDAEVDDDPEGEGLLQDAIDVVVEMVTRVFLNPRRERSRSENIGTGPLSEAVTVTAGGENPGKLYLAADELAKLQPPVERGGAFEIDLMPAAPKGLFPWPW
ncbi:hypothetical protein Leucomu_05695 [Leucobacter muris]|uniref:Head-to-tail adaptor n=1 Tax=Leucobacter muris TaxID=1935379 RepID=A0ABX5QEH7_9MICO|nr:hypothetical protein [Leucobacter muris]QAB17481.1 hypothetical protein Leucomu_05695 [Leucobacter muris]